MEIGSANRKLLLSLSHTKFSLCQCVKKSMYIIIIRHIKFTDNYFTNRTAILYYPYPHTLEY